MAHFAQIDENNVVVQVLVVPDEQETRGQEYLADDLNLGGIWVQTSYNNNIRKRYAGIGMTYDPVNDVFITAKPFESWVLNAEFDWEAPVAMPQDGQPYTWNEEAQSWDVVQEPTA